MPHSYPRPSEALSETACADDLEHNRKYADALDVTFWHVPNNTGAS